MTGLEVHQPQDDCRAYTTGFQSSLRRYRGASQWRMSAVRPEVDNPKPIPAILSTANSP